MTIERLRSLLARCEPLPWPVVDHGHAHIAEIVNVLPALIAVVEAASVASENYLRGLPESTTKGPLNYLADALAKLEE